MEPNDTTAERGVNYEVRCRHSTPRNISKESRRVANFSRLLGLGRYSSDEESFYESEVDNTDDDNETEEDGGDSDAPTPLTPLLEREVLAGLSTWFERLFEGSLRRYHVSEWPRNLKCSL